LSTKDRKILDLEKALVEEDETSKKHMSEILEKLKLLFEEYKKSLNEFGVLPAPLPADIGIPEFMDWMETEFQALSKVISGTSNFVAAFSVESILKILHDFDCADVEKFREKICQFPSATSTSIIRAMKMFRPLRTNSRGNSGSPAEMRPSRSSRVLNLPR
jgi:hypothetical protein